MPTRPKTAKTAAARLTPVPPQPRKASSGGRTTLAELRAKATAETASVDFKPYVITDVEPPITIEIPDSADAQLGLAELFGMTGEFHIADARRVLQLVCGEAFDRVWEVFGKEHVMVLIALVEDMGRHFQEQAEAAEAAKLKEAAAADGV